MSINAARFQSVLKGMTVIAQKVYAAVPKAESWHYTQIQSELMRLNTGRDINVTRGCLNTLKEAGLIQEAPQNQFMRVHVRGLKVKLHELTPDFTHDNDDDEKETEMATLNLQPKAPATAPTPFEKMAALAANVLVLGDSMKKLSADLEMALLEMEELMQQRESKMVKLTQLQSLLKDLA